MTAIPSVQYVQNGAFRLAYQVAGSGGKDLVYLLFETPNVVANWFDPAHARFIKRREHVLKGVPERWRLYRVAG